MSKHAILQHGYYTIGSNKGQPRIWLQGGNLSQSGFKKGAYYEKTLDLDSGESILRIIAAPNEKSCVVSGRKTTTSGYNPIIDIANSEILDVTKGAKKVRADFYENEIRISVHHLDKKQAEREGRLKANLRKGEISKGVLCCGIGMSTAAEHDGLLSMGIQSRTEFIVDRERKYLDVARQNNHAVDEKTRIFEASLEEVEPELLGYADMLSFSLECSGHSLAGKAKRSLKCAEEHPTGAAGVLGLIQIISAVQPSIISSENVVQARESASYILLKQMLDVLGYYVSEIELDSNQTQSLEA